MRLSKVTYALIAAGVGAGLATFYTHLDSLSVGAAHAATQPPALVAPAVAATAAANLPDFTALVDRAGASVVNISTFHAQEARARRTSRTSTRTARIYEFFKRFGGVPERPGHAPAATVARHGLGLHREPGRLHRDQRARRRRRDRSRREAHRSPRVHGQGRRHRQAHRHRARQDRGEEPAGARPRRQARREARRMGDRDRLAVRLREQRVGRCRERRASRAAGRADGAVHPDRRRRQSGQFGRPAAQRRGPGGRRQLADLQPLRRLHGPVVRDSGGRRGEGRRPAEDARQGAARTPRHRHPGPRPDAGAELRARRLQRRARRPGREGQSRRRRPASSPAT